MRSGLLRRIGAFLGASVLCAALGAGTALAHPDQGEAPEPIPVAGPASGGAQPAEPFRPGPDQKLPRDPNQRVKVVVTLKKQPSQPSERQEQANLSAQEGMIRGWENKYGFQIDRQFGYLFNGVSGTMPLAHLQALSQEPQVESVRRERVYERVEHTARDLHGVPPAFAKHGVDGTGMVISIIDSGIDPAHEDMRLDDCSKAAIQAINPVPEAGFTCKVPNGYNYADENFRIKEKAHDSHGMHVAGIAAANGSAGDTPDDVTQTRRIDGIAPNAQLLAMRVFGESGLGADDSDIIAAIEDSVKMGADVINMSLGAPNGQKNESDGSWVAIQKAREAGVVTVIAAGNEGQNFSADGLAGDAFGILDDGTVGSPGVQGDALTVASIDNTRYSKALAYFGDPEQKAPYTLVTGFPDGQPHALVDLGQGTADDVKGKDLDGAYALVERGGISFEEKYENVMSAGAGGIVVYNDEAGGDSFFRMSGVWIFDIPGVTISHADGLRMREAIAAGVDTIRLSGDVALVDNATGMQPSVFTSWGTTPTLDFEPEIAGIGGGVYSTYNDDAYGNSSGTSMASPNVAGVTALLLEDLQRKNPQLQGAKRADTAKTLLMNTAVVPVNSANIPYSPRQIGAGLANIDAALATPVMASVDGQGAAALREVHGPATFTVTLENFSDHDYTYEIPAGQPVLAETNEAGFDTLTRVSGGSISTSASAVTVPAHGTATVQVTITPESGADHFLGGWVSFEATSADAVNLRVPFLGFAGDWNKEPIILPPGQLLDPQSLFQSELVTMIDGFVYPIARENGTLWLSPNADGNADQFMPNLAVMRNASDAEFQILDAQGNVVTTIAQQQGLERDLIAGYLELEDPRFMQPLGPEFDGLVWDAQNAQDAVAPDGRYVYRIRTRLSPDYPWQQVDFPFGIDTTAPVIEFGEIDNGLLSVTVIEDGSGLLDELAVADHEDNALPVTQISETEFTVPVDPDITPVVTAEAMDAGMNVGAASKVLTSGRLYIANAQQLQAGVLGPGGLIEYGSLDLTVHVSADITQVQVGDEKPGSVENGRFTGQVPLVQGENRIVVRGLNAAGELVAEEEIVVRYDSIPPMIYIRDDPRDASGHVEVGDTLELSGVVSDEREYADLSLVAWTGEGEIPVQLDENGEFDVSIPIDEGQWAVELMASDGVNQTWERFWLSDDTWFTDLISPLEPSFTNIACEINFRICSIGDGSHSDFNEDEQTFTVHGVAMEGTGSISFTPGLRVGDDGTYPDPTPIEATFDEDLNFTAELPMRTGANHFRAVVTDENGEVAVDQPVVFLLDLNPPTLSMEEPTLVGGTLYTNTEQVRLRGTAEDDGWGYTFSVNQSVVVQRLEPSTNGAQANRRSFDTEITVADGDTIFALLTDTHQNQLVALIPVVLDQDGPRIDISNMQDGEIISDQRSVAVSATDPHLATMEVVLDGEMVDSQSTELVSKEHPFEEAFAGDYEFTGPEDEDPDSETDPVPSADNEVGEDSLTELNAEDATGEPADDSDATGHTDEETDESGPETDGDAGEADAVHQYLTDPSMAKTEPAQTTLEAMIDTSELTPGEHHLAVRSRDLAGNVTTESVSFVVDWTLQIEGPDEVTVEATRDQLTNQQWLADQVTAAYTVQLNGSEEEAAKVGARLHLAPSTVLVEGVQTVPVIATDDTGRVTDRDVTVTVTVKASPATPGEKPGDGSGGKPGNGPGDNSGDGSDDKPGNGPGDNSGDGSGEKPGGDSGRGDGDGSGSAGPRKGGTTPGDGSRGSGNRPGNMARTGIETGGALAVIAALIGTGALALGVRRQKSAAPVSPDRSS